MTTLRRRLALWLMCGIIAAPASHAEPAATLNEDIAAQPLAPALAEFGRQTGIQMAYPSTLVEARSSPGAPAGLEASDALAKLLAGTKLRFEFLNERTVGIYPEDRAAPDAVPPPASRQHHAVRSAELGIALEEVVVTATRREEQVNRVPISMTVWTQDTMEASGIKGMAQLGALTPGIDFSYRAGLGADLYTDLAIRAVNNRGGAVASLYLDDVPIPPVRAGTYLRSFPYMFDLDRVEILRGPQSMLLGDHTQAGAVRFFMKQPNLTEYSALARAEWATTAGGAPGYEFGAAAGGPIVDDRLGFRASAWYQEQGGYVDRVDPFTSITLAPSSNSVISKTAHVAVTYAPTDNVLVTPSVTYQSTNIRDTSTFFTALSNFGSGDFRNAYTVQQPYTDNYNLAALRVTAALGHAELTSLSSYFHRTATATFDFTSRPLIDNAHFSMWYPAEEQRVFFQEARMSSTDPGSMLTWMAGATYSINHTDSTQTFSDAGQATLGDTMRARKSDLEAYVQGELKLSQRFTASAGIRYGRASYDYVTEFAPVSQDAITEHWTAPRFVLSCRPNEQQLFYASIAKGVGTGGVYADAATSPVTPKLQPPDGLWSYEIGGKNNLADGRVHLDLSLFNIHWNNGQFGPALISGEVATEPGAFDINGIDLAMQARLKGHLRLAVAAEYAAQRLARTVTLGEGVVVKKGAVTSAPLSATVSIDSDFPLRSGVSVNGRIEDVFHREAVNNPFNSNPASPYYATVYNAPSTNVINIRGAIQWPRFDAAVLVSNALNGHPKLQGGPGWPDSSLEIAETLVPRTVSLTGTWRY